MYNHSVIKNCPITGDTNKIEYFSLGEIPLVNNLCSTMEESLTAIKFPLNVNYYPSSGESSLDFAVDSTLLFSNYLFKSQVNIPYHAHCKHMFEYIKNYVEIQDNTCIADIGGNDGTLLDIFRNSTNKNLNLLNIDPSQNLTKLCLDKGIPVNVNFFDYDIASTINNKFDVITSTNVFQHLKDINGFAKGIEHILSNNGIWLLEFPYWIHNMETNQFDQIYHEHMYYHSVTPIKMLMENHGLKIINITTQNMHGGSLRLIITKKDSKFTPDNTINQFLSYEKKFDLNYHINWGKNIFNYIKKSSEFIKSLKKENKTIMGFGAAAKGCIYLNAMGINYNHIDCVIDDTDIKQNKFIPGTGIKIVSREILKEKTPDYILILAHNFAEYIIKSLENVYSNKFIILVPEIKVI
jgi:hypothetical protein